jgi:hypothetical protein
MEMLCSAVVCVNAAGGSHLLLETVPGKYSELEVFGKCHSLPERQMLREEKRCLAVFALLWFSLCYEQNLYSMLV